MCFILLLCRCRKTIFTENACTLFPSEKTHTHTSIKNKSRGAWKHFMVADTAKTMGLYGGKFRHRSSFVSEFRSGISDSFFLHVYSHFITKLLSTYIIYISRRFRAKKNTTFTMNKIYSLVLQLCVCLCHLSCVFETRACLSKFCDGVAHWCWDA